MYEPRTAPDWLVMVIVLALFVAVMVYGCWRWPMPQMAP